MQKSFLNNFGPFIKYCIVGASGTFVDLASLYIFVEYLNIPLLPAVTLSFLLAVINNFILNKIWTFKNKSKNYRKLFIKFLIVSVFGLLLTLLCMYILVNQLEIWYMISKLITSGVVLTWNFLANKLWTFQLRTADFEHSPNLELSIIIPAYNEENRVGKTLEKVRQYIKEKNLNAEIIIVNDGSTDNTNKFATHGYPKNQGKGFAVKTGIENANGRLILFTDADNSTPIEEYEKLKEALKEADIAIGSRYLKDSNIKRKQPFYRILIGRIGNGLIRLFLIDNIKDTQCGFKLFKANVAKEIFSLQKVKRFGFDMEALLIAKHLGYKITEVPVSWINSEDSRVRPIKDGLRTLRDLVYIKINLWCGRYEKD